MFARIRRAESRKQKKSRQIAKASYFDKIYLTKFNKLIKAKTKLSKRTSVKMEFNMEDGTFTSNEDVPYALVIELPSGSSPENWDFDNFVLWIQSQELQTLLGIGMIAILMIAILGAKRFCRNEEPVEEPVEEEVRPRGLFSQVIDKTMSFFGH